MTNVWAGGQLLKDGWEIPPIDPQLGDRVRDRRGWVYELRPDGWVLIYGGSYHYTR